MVDVQHALYIITTLAALSTVVSGIVVLNRIFKGDVLSDVFTDAHHEVYVLILLGFSLFALGEVTWLMIFEQQGMEALSSVMPDVYWMVGAIIILLGVGYGAYRVVADSRQGKYAPLVLLAAAAGGGIMYVVLSSMGLSSEGGVGETARFMYPILSFMSLVMSGVLYYFANDKYYVVLRPLLFISMGIFAGDMLFVMSGETYGTIEILTNLAYTGSYLGVAWMFLGGLKAITGLRQ